MNKAQFTYHKFLYFLENKIPFSFARYGDGEFNAILGCKKQYNCDHHKYFADMGLTLAQVLRSQPTYILGIQSLAMRVRGVEIQEFVKDFNLSWCDADILHKASIKGKLHYLFNALDRLKDKIVIVGPKYLKRINSKFAYKHFIDISQTDCWLETNDIINKCARILINSNNMVFLFSGSMAANVWIDILHDRFGEDNTFLDCGSVWDPYLNINKRSYHKDIIDRERQKKTS